MNYTTNSLGMNLISIPAGSFTMGQELGGEIDEKPAYSVRISQDFLISETPVTNLQYEQYSEEHRSLRGSGPSEGPIEESLENDYQIRYSIEDDDAVIMVTWHDAQGFCDWLSEKEGRHYRLPTEAEWEYACRAGSSAEYSTGSELPEEFHLRQMAHNRDFRYGDASLRVGQTAQNDFGVRNMNGLVEEWCEDWYSPYPGPQEIENPQGPAEGYSDVWAKVTRGGSHHTSVYDLRSASRMAAHPDSRSWFIGFRVVAGPPLEVKKQEAANRFTSPLCRLAVVQDAWDWKRRPFIADMNSAHFTGPIPFVIEPSPVTYTPFFRHNHCPALTWCANGDLLACWFSTEDERGRGMVILASRLRAGSNKWEPASLFFDIPKRNPTGSSLWHDGNGRIVHVNSVTPAGTWSDCIVVLRESTDNGSTWSPPRLISREHDKWQRVIAGMISFGSSDNKTVPLLQPCDAGCDFGGATRFLRSLDGGHTWNRLNTRETPKAFVKGGTGPLVAGVHAAVAERADGSLIAVGRDTEIDARLPISISTDSGESWSYSASPFLPVGTGQRPVLLSLREGPLLLISFTNQFRENYDGFGEYPEDGIDITDSSGESRRVFGLFAALSEDGGLTWPARKILTDNRNAEYLETGDSAPNLKGFWMGPSRAEHSGYMAATQTPDNAIHVISSHWYYRFNIQWIRTPLPAMQL